MDHPRTLFLVTMGIFLFACGSLAPASDPTLSAASTDMPSTPTLEESTPPPRPTITLTPTVWPPVFDVYRLEEIPSLDSFVFTVIESNTVNGQLTEITNTIGYIREPYSAYLLRKYSGGEERTYVIDGRTYNITGSGDWYLSGRASQDLFSAANPANLAGKLVGAQFAGQEEINGILANHFVLEPVNSADSSLEGEVHVAHDGNYIISSHWNETASGQNFAQSYEVTAELSSINQVTEITLPSDLLEMKTALDLPQEIGLPLPADSALSTMTRYAYGLGVDIYTFSTPKVSIDEFLNYYRALPQTDGWTVSHVGHVNLHENDCEFSRECVIINKGSTQVILYYNGSAIRAEFDWPHLYSPK
jgi:hypothetical protein